MAVALLVLFICYALQVWCDPEFFRLYPRDPHCKTPIAAPPRRDDTRPYL
jgi:hypothetical protein